MSESLQGLIAGWLSAPLIGLFFWLIWLMIKMGLEQRREKKEEFLSEMISKAAKKALADLELHSCPLKPGKK